jgi:hypothetical protein
MAHFALINQDNLVQQVIVVDNADAPGDFPESEPLGQQFISNTLKLPGVWLQTSYNNNFRGVFAGIGYIYNSQADQFQPGLEE